LQRLVGRKKSDFTQGFSARGRPFGCGRRLALLMSNDGRWSYQAGFIHANVSFAQINGLPERMPLRQSLTPFRPLRRSS
jgi:hypothetical protein